MEEWRSGEESKAVYWIRRRLADRGFGFFTSLRMTLRQAQGKLQGWAMTERRFANRPYRVRERGNGQADDGVCG